MRVAMDAVGRLVVPKRLRETLGVSGPTELEVVVRDGVIELTVADVHARVEERDGVPVIVGESATPIDVDDVRAAVERTRR
jgi:bifunctional DNA-binding transcriptional regulator/antitoxin component of YhaV-PrlF toxin-antitoxin module